MPRREFHFTEGSSNKFWSIEREGAALKVHFGKMGTAGQAQQKDFASEAAAEKEEAKLIAEKVKKGYLEAAGGATGATGTPIAVVKSATAPAPKAAKKSATATATATAAAEPAAADTTAGEISTPAAEPESATAPVVTLAEDGSLVREIRLDPVDRLVVTWEPHVPLTVPPSPPFTREAGLARLAKVKGDYFWAHQWQAAAIPEYPSEEECLFWIQAVLTAQRMNSAIAKTVEEMRGAAALKTLSITQLDVIGNVITHYNASNITLAPCLRNFIDHHWNVSPGSPEFYVTIYLQYHVGPLASAERASQAARAAKDLKCAVPGLRGLWPARVYQAAALGCGPEVAQLLAALPDGHFAAKDQWSRLVCDSQWLVFSLGSPEAVEAEFRRLGLILQSPAQVRAWLALTGWRALDVLVSAVVNETNRDAAETLAAPLLLVSAPEAAAAALQIRENSKAQAIGQRWLNENALHAAIGLAGLATGSGKLASAARDHLRRMAGPESRGILEAALPHLPENQRNWLRREALDNAELNAPLAALTDLPEALQTAFAGRSTTNKSKGSPLISASTLPPIIVEGKRLAGPQVEVLLAELKSVPLAEKSPLFAALRQHAAPTGLDEFAWQLFKAWLAMGAPSKEKWCLGGIGHLGGDGCVLQLTPMIRDWPGESQHQRATFGLEVLRSVGSDTALMALNGIALKLKFAALKERAKELMEAIASDRGLSREQLADRIVPDCGLDERGSRVFDFGPRQFQFVLGAELKPLVRDAAGKVKPDLPAPNNSDDKPRAEAAVTEWKLLKKTLKEALKVQGERLEQAMITSRRWTAEEFQQLIVRHPLMVNLARGIIFAHHGPDGAVQGTFRITEDQTLADREDNQYHLPADATVGIIHRAHLDDAAAASWGELLSDYELFQPFPQLSRGVATPDPADLQALEITRFRGRRIPGISLYGILEKNQWLKDTPADAGGFNQHSRHFPAADTTAFISYEPGMGIGWYEETQEITVYFAKGHVKPAMWGGWGTGHEKIPVGQVDRVVASEVLRLAHVLVSKAE